MLVDCVPSDSLCEYQGLGSQASLSLCLTACLDGLRESAGWLRNTSAKQCHKLMQRLLQGQDALKSMD